MMLTMRKKFVFSLADLRYVSIACQHCNTRVVLDLQEPSGHAKTYGSYLTNECPGCLKAYDTSVHPAIVGLHGAYNNLAKVGKFIEFCGAREIELPSEQ